MEAQDWHQDLARVQENLIFVETYSLAVVDRSWKGELRGSCVSWLPVFLQKSTQLPFVQLDGAWTPISEVQGFVRYQDVNKKKRYDPLRGEMVEVRS